MSNCSPETAALAYSVTVTGAEGDCDGETLTLELGDLLGLELGDSGILLVYPAADHFAAYIIRKIRYVGLQNKIGFCWARIVTINSVPR